MKKRILAIFIALVSLTLTSCTNYLDMSNTLTETNISIYQHPNERSQKIYSNPREEEVTLIRSYHADWNKVFVLGTEGFMKRDSNFTPKGKSIPLYSCLDESSSIIRNIPEGTELPLASVESTEWVRTFYDGTFGYVKSEDLKFDIETGSIIAGQKEEFLEADDSFNNDDSEIIKDSESNNIVDEDKEENIKDREIKENQTKSSKKQSIVFGIDVSHLNNFSSGKEIINYMQEKNISFAYIRCGGRGYGLEGNMYTDKKWREYVSACENAGIPYGLYYYSSAITKLEAREEAKYILRCLNEIKDNKYNTIPVAIDVEQRRGSRTDKYLTTGLLRDMTQIIIDELTKQNQNVVIYSDVSTYEDALLYECRNCNFWLAQLTENANEYMKLKLKKQPKYGSIVAQQIEFGEKNGEGVDYDVAPASFII